MTAVSAHVSGWSDPQPTDSKFSIGQDPLPTIVQYRYCLWTYSDGSTQQQVYQTKYSTTSGNDGMMADPAYDCTVDNAPAAN